MAWLNELVFHTETQKLVFDDLKVEAIEGDSLVASIRGRAPRAAGTPIKGATMHEVRVDEAPGGFEAEVTVDV